MIRAVKEFLRKLISGGLAGCLLYGAVYLVPPDIDDLRISSVSKGILKIGTWPYDSLCLSDPNIPKRCKKSYQVEINGSTKTAVYSCVLIPKINCRMGTPTLKVSLMSVQALERNLTGGYSTAQVGLVDIREESYDENYFIVCGAIGTANGNLLLTNLNNNGSYDKDNPSFLYFSYSEFCQ